LCSETPLAKIAFRNLTLNVIPGVMSVFSVFEEGRSNHLSIPESHIGLGGVFHGHKSEDKGARGVGD
jgi:hypothetical protein